LRVFLAQHGNFFAEFIGRLALFRIANISPHGNFSAKMIEGFSLSEILQNRSHKKQAAAKCSCLF
jgi:hypothetical protein